MGILEKISGAQRAVVYATDDMFFGAPEAEAEANPNSRIHLVEFFEDYLGVIRQLQTEKFIILGRKGTGKTAIAEYIHELSGNDANSFCSFIRLNDERVQNLAQLGENKNEFNRSDIVEWLILFKFVELLLQNNAICDDSNYASLRKFMSKNSGFVDLEKFETRRIDKETTAAVDIEYFKRFFTSHFKHKLGINEEKAPFYKMIPSLTKTVVSLLTSNKDRINENEYLLFFDDLDIHFSVTSAEDMGRLAELVRLVKRFNNDLFGDNNVRAKIVLLIREDIADKLCQNETDIAKMIASYAIRLNWFDKSLFDNNIEALPLKRLVNKRIQLNLERKKIPCPSDPWTALFVEQSNNYSLLKDILDLTFMRPRNLVLFLQHVENMRAALPLGLPSVTKLKREYTIKAIYELKSELCSSLTQYDIEAIFSALKKVVINYGGSPIKAFEKEFKAAKVTLDTQYIMELLFHYSVIGQCTSLGGGNHNMRYMYRDSDQATCNVDFSGLFVLHKLLQEYSSIGR